MYSPAYMHFDTLIWQVPAWSSAMFAAYIGGLIALADNHAQIEDVFGVAPRRVGAGLSLMVVCFQFCSLYVLRRFIAHQRGCMPCSNHPRPLVGGQAALTGIMVIQLLGALVVLALQGGTLPATVMAGVLACVLAIRYCAQDRRANETSERARS